MRTPGTLARSTVFKTAAFNHSATPPQEQIARFLHSGPESKPCHEIARIVVCLLTMRVTSR